MITILNDPAICFNNFPGQIAGRLYRSGKYFFFKKSGQVNGKRYRGHPAVTRSILTGLSNLNYSYVHNPVWQSQISNIVWVLSGVQTLEYALNLKRKGVVDKIVAGPNIVTFSDDFHSLIGDALVDLCLVPSSYVKHHYLKYCPALTDRCEVWPAGVDINFWHPSTGKASKVLFYIKDNSILNEVEQLRDALSSKGIDCLSIIYGNYTKNEYLNALQSSVCMIVFSRSESQGLALAEAWSANVPTFVRSVNIETISGRTFECSSAPYLNENTGKFFRTICEASQLIYELNDGKSHYAPRKWVIQNMSDSVSAELCLSLLKSHGVINAS